MTEEHAGKLSFAEEIMLLLLDDQSGRFEHTAGGTTRYALSGAVLMDLALLNRIDTDLNELILLDGTPLQDPMFDPTLAAIQHAGQRHDARYWVERIGDSPTTSARQPSTGWWNAGFWSARKTGSCGCSDRGATR